MMRKASLLFVALMIAISVPCFANAKRACDPNAGVTRYTLTGPSWLPTTVAAQWDGSLKVDVTVAAVGTTSVTLKACIVDLIWGTVRNTAVSFSFPRPGSPFATTGPELTP
jgi:hypothetical protein